jgi:hypothetical protein
MPSALKGQNMTAWGIAPGNRPPKSQSPERAIYSESALSALNAETQRLATTSDLALTGRGLRPGLRRRVETMRQMIGSPAAPEYIRPG